MDGLVRNPLQQINSRYKPESFDKQALRRLNRYIIRLRVVVHKVTSLSQNRHLHSQAEEVLAVRNAESPFDARERIDLIYEFLDQWCPALENSFPDLGEMYRNVRYANVDIETPSKKVPYRGVTDFRNGKLWLVRLELPSGKTYNKYRKSEIDAALHYDEMVHKYFPDETWRLNFVRDGETVYGRPLNLREKRYAISGWLKRHKSTTRPKGAIFTFPPEKCDALLKKYSILPFTGKYTNVK